jgi:tetratricopeptide (TPR) repeat protein
MLEQASEAGTDIDLVSHARVLATLASELTFAGDLGRVTALSDEAVAVARRVGDPATLVHVLNARWSTIWVPDTLDERLALTAEVLALADAVGDPAAGLLAAAHQVQAHLENADPLEAERAVAAVVEAAAITGLPTHAWLAAMARALMAIAAGDLERAETLAIEALQTGNDAGERDALGVFGTQLATIRFQQGRLGEMAATFEQLADDVPGFRSALAVAYWEAGRFDDARKALALDASQRVSDLPYDATWLTTMVLRAESCWLLEDLRVASALYEPLRPWHGRVACTGGSVLGAVAHFLGELAAVMRRYGDAAAYFAEAEATHERLGSAFFLARTRLAWARMLVDCDGPGDGEKARRLANRALGAAEALNMSGLQKEAAHLLRE